MICDNDECIYNEKRVCCYTDEHRINECGICSNMAYIEL